MRLVLIASQAVQRCTIAHSPSRRTSIAIGSIGWRHTAARSPGSSSKCRDHRQHGQWLRCFVPNDCAGMWCLQRMHVKSESTRDLCDMGVVENRGQSDRDRAPRAGSPRACAPRMEYLMSEWNLIGSPRPPAMANHSTAPARALTRKGLVFQGFPRHQHSSLADFAHGSSHTRHTKPVHATRNPARSGRFRASRSGHGMVRQWRTSATSVHDSRTKASETCTDTHQPCHNSLTADAGAAPPGPPSQGAPSPPARARSARTRRSCRTATPS